MIAVNKNFLCYVTQTNYLKIKICDVFFFPLKILKEKDKTEFLIWNLYIILSCHSSGVSKKNLKEIKKRVFSWVLNIDILSELPVTLKYKFLVVFIKIHYKLHLRNQQAFAFWVSHFRKCLHEKHDVLIVHDAISHTAVLTCCAFQFDPSTEDKLGITHLNTDLWAS